MRLRLVLLGIALLMVGLLAYSAVPNIHRTVVLESRTVMGPETIPIRNGSIVIRGLSLQGPSNELEANITVIAERGDLSPLRLQLFLRNSSATCTHFPNAFLVNQDVANQSLTVPIQTPGTYCLVFDNDRSQLAMTKNVTSVAALHSRSEKTTATNDGEVNMAGLGLGAFGFLVLVYGVSRKSVIPWE